MKQLVQKLKTHDSWLFNVASFHAVLAVMTVAGLLLDSRFVTGVNPWIKPIKFDISLVIYTLTMAWILQFLPKQDSIKIGRRIAICMVIEIVLIYLQAARGTSSHFNVAAPIDGLIFGTMGVVIAYNTYLIFRVFLFFVRNHESHKRLFSNASERLALQYGLLSLLIGSFMGGYMASQKGHTVGASDGGPGLPFLNWSTQFGDLRVAHFVGMHGVQLFLLLGWSLAKSHSQISPVLQRGVLHATFAGFTLLNLALLVQALLAQPFWGM